jgi:hypothetical protein
MLGNELLKAAFRGMRGTKRCLRIKPAPSTIQSPRILGRLDLSSHIDAVLHRKANVILSIRKPSDLCDWSNSA